MTVYDDILKQIIDSMTITREGSIQWQGFESTQYNRNLSLLISNLMIDEDFQVRLNSLRYYFNIESDVFFGFELLSIFKEMKQEQKISFTIFKDKLNIFLDNLEKTSKPIKFEVYYPINVKTDKKIDSIKFRDVPIEIKNYEDVKVLLDDKKLTEGVFRFEKFTKSKYKYIHITVWSRNSNYAVEIAVKYANLILGFIAYSQNYNSNPITIIGVPKEFTQLKLNYGFVFKEGSYLVYFFFDDKSDDKKFYDLKEWDIKNLNDFVIRFNNTNTKFQEVLYKSISSYYQGLTETRINYSFLNFWTSLEIITLKKKGLRHVEIIKRLKSILSNLTPLEPHKIDKLYSIRNNLVHDATYNISQYDRNLMKAYAEIMIEFFIFHLTKFNSEEVQSVFQFLQKSDSTLAKSKDLIDFVINLRKNPKTTQT